MTVPKTQKGISSIRRVPPENNQTQNHLFSRKQHITYKNKKNIKNHPNEDTGPRKSQILPKKTQGFNYTPQTSKINLYKRHKIIKIG